MPHLLLAHFLAYNPFMPSKSNNKLSSKQLANLVSDNNHLISEVLLQSIDPLVDSIIKSIRPLIADYIIKMRNQLFNTEEFTTINRASKILNIYPSTIYNWREKDLITIFHLGNKALVSLTQLKQVLNSSTTRVINKSRVA